MCIEVKRQEALSVNTWWKQCTDAAKQNGETPVLLYRQNGKKWRCVVMAGVPLPARSTPLDSLLMFRVEMSWDDFLAWFEQWVQRQLVLGHVPRV
jgi:hypothetical protein